MIDRAAGLSGIFRKLKGLFFLLSNTRRISEGMAMGIMRSPMGYMEWLLICVRLILG